MEKPFKPELRLIVQASIPVQNDTEGDAEYENLKTFLLAISPDITMNGQIIKMLEPCCQKKKGAPDDEKDT